MIWTVQLICLVSLGQASLPSLAEIVSRARWCLGENAHCPVNIYKNFDLCCKPFMCTVIPKTCKPNFINNYFNLSEYKDYRCMLPNQPIFSTELRSQSVVSTKREKREDNELTTVNPFRKIASKVNSFNKMQMDSTNMNNEVTEILNQIDLSNETYSEIAKQNSSEILLNESVNQSVVDNQLCSDDTNEIRPLVKKYISNDSNSDNSLSISSISVENNQTLMTELSSSSIENERSSNTPYLNESGSNTPYLSENDSSIMYSDSSSASTSDESDYGTNETIMEEPKVRSNLDQLGHKKCLISHSGKENSSNLIDLAKSEEDWHSSDMKYDTRPKVNKIVTVQPPKLFHSIEVVKLNLSSDISE